MRAIQELGLCSQSWMTQESVALRVDVESVG
jgi:hypothetical protein